MLGCRFLEDESRIERLECTPDDGKRRAPRTAKAGRRQSDHAGINESIKAVCFPTGVTICSSFDKDLIREMGENLGEACQAEEPGRSAGAGRQYQEVPPVRSELRIFFRRSLSCGRDGRFPDQGHPEQRGGNQYKALSGQQPGAQKNVIRFPGRRKNPAGDISSHLRKSRERRHSPGR